MGWAAGEFRKIDLGDKRLDSRLVKLCNSFSESPESPSTKPVLTGLRQKLHIDSFKMRMLMLSELCRHIVQLLPVVPKLIPLF